MLDKQTIRNGMLAVITTLLISAALRASYPVTMPLAVAAILISAIWPVKPFLDRALPSKLSFVATALILLVLIAGFVAAVYFSAAQIVRAFAQNWDQLETGYRSVTQWADKWGLTVGGQQGYSRLIGFGQDLLSNAYTILIYLGFIAILVVLGGASLTKRNRANTSQVLLVERIFRAAGHGERDPDRLRAAALVCLAPV